MNTRTDEGKERELQEARKKGNQEKARKWENYGSEASSVNTDEINTKKKKLDSEEQKT